MSESIPEPPGTDEQPAVGEQVGDDHPLQIGDGETEVLVDRRERDVDRGVEGREGAGDDGELPGVADLHGPIAQNRPPSTMKLCAVQAPASSLARNSTIWANSSG